ncbi:copper amine oxidase N-terminal domain-containing protein [Paenibacillus sp. FJAT-27812]|uniref:copper amine oxidase N-terminal domain-containing protein n=1 Tax=Paenibacillus sp. FJAT-27812 TaxID=1684143 RepID=UPI0006A7A32A|nr:copper amine oxidase N-terminal domain-containing protein [Paenibacillus sp. FJAT-27812]
MMKRGITAFILALLLILPTTAGAAAQAKYQFSWDDGRTGSISGTALVKNGVTFVPMTGVINQSRLELSWDSTGKRAQFNGWRKSFAVRIGNLTGMVDGKMIKLDGAPFLYNKELYLPARFVVNALNGKNITWDAGSKTFKADHLQTFKKYEFVIEGLKYAIEGKSGDIYVTDSKGTQRLLTKLGAPIWEYLNIGFQKTQGGLLVVNLADNYGEPHLNNQQFTLVIKEGKVIQQSSVHYWNRLELNATKFNERLILIDGKTLRLIEDGTGKVVETIDLVKLGGEDDNYFVEYFDNDVFLLRANKSGILKLVDRDTGKISVLYKELLDAKHQEYVETNDMPYLGDFLKIIKRDGDTLVFKNEFPYDKDNNTYRFAISE